MDNTAKLPLLLLLLLLLLFRHCFCQPNSLASL
jgi:hypothetical protein